MLCLEAHFVFLPLPTFFLVFIHLFVSTIAWKVFEGLLWNVGKNPWNFVVDPTQSGQLEAIFDFC